eukprot:gnl/MRDRNA2_/MRDRNA2_114291_c0_seq1.p1 gnl/MRDRNA2_/MRDRNA2_114291_c0~~gnl/MRDRNA2_/MRDRNA2_114291_c0_seq1.p1  ORF type:complete len:191 (-),score=44.99 gnl/MRDRNA2_/MRDRNA2_114291_c0_seq1:90-662(-)
MVDSAHALQTNSDNEDAHDEDSALPPVSARTPRGGELQEHRTDRALRGAIESLDTALQKQPSINDFKIERFMRGGEPAPAPAAGLGSFSIDAMFMAAMHHRNDARAASPLLPARSEASQSTCTGSSWAPSSTTGSGIGNPYAELNSPMAASMAESPPSQGAPVQALRRPRGNPASVGRRPRPAGGSRSAR